MRRRISASRRATWFFMARRALPMSRRRKAHSVASRRLESAVTSSLAACQALTKFLQFFQGPGGRRLGLGAHGLGKQGEHAGIDTVGLFQAPRRLGEAPRAIGIDDGDGQAAGCERAPEVTVPASGRLKDDHGDVHLAEGAFEGLDALPVVGHAPGFAGRVCMDVEPAFADVATDVDCRSGTSCILALHSGPRSHSSVQASREGAADQAHPRAQAPKGGTVLTARDGWGGHPTRPGRIFPDSARPEHARG